MLVEPNSEGEGMTGKIVICGENGDLLDVDC